MEVRMFPYPSDWLNTDHYGVLLYLRTSLAAHGPLLERIMSDKYRDVKTRARGYPHS